MSDWVHGLPVAWMAVVVFAFAYLVAAAIYAAVTVLAAGERARWVKAVSPGLLSPLGVVFGLFVAFTAAQVWSDSERAYATVNREAGALKGAVIFASSFPGEPETRLRALIRGYIKTAVGEEWPMMSRRNATLRVAPPTLDQALRLTLALVPNTRGQQIAQRELATAFESTLEARLQRIIISRSQVNLLKWLCLFLQAALVLVAIAMVHSDNRAAGAISMAIFAAGVAASVLLILAHDRPFVGQISVGPGPLLQVNPAGEDSAKASGPGTSPQP